MTVILVNRSLSKSHLTTVNLTNFTMGNGTYQTQQLNSLPSGETFISKSSNALKPGTVTVSANSMSLTLPALSTTAVVLKGTALLGIEQEKDNILNAVLYPNPVSDQTIFVNLSEENNTGLKIELFNTIGELVYSKLDPGKAASRIEIPCGDLHSGVYFIRLSSVEGKTWSSRFVKM